MLLSTNDFLKRFNHVEMIKGLYYTSMMQEKRPYVICDDGFGVSIQASDTHYCYPRENGLDHYDKVELGFPTDEDEVIMDYAEDPEDPTGTVYGYVPVKIVDDLLKKHGGITRVRIFEHQWWHTDGCWPVGDIEL